MSEPFIGEIKIIGFGFAPRGWSTCAGQLLPISQNTALFSLLGTTFGGDGRTTFGLPDLRSRSPVGGGMGAGPGLDTIAWGQKAGNINHTMTQAQLAGHTHGYKIDSNSSAAGEDDPDGNFPAPSSTPIYAGGKDSEMAQMTTQSTGNSQSFSIRNPYLGLFHVIALTGIFPSRS